MENLIMFKIILLFLVSVNIAVARDDNFRRQSPISLRRKKASSFSVPAITFNNYDTLMDLYGENDGYTANFNIPERYQSEITIENNIVPGTFKAVHFHFHWGSNNRIGAEHLVENKRHSMELHIVHMNTKYTESEALKYKDGLLVLSVLLQASNTMSSFYNEISQQVRQLQEYKSKTLIENFSLNTFLKNVNKDNFFLYEGSLTTPPYAETVTWIVFADIQTIGSQELNIFRSLKRQDGNLILNNHRRLFPINGRRILKREL